jgi:TonB family protein
MKPRNAVLVSLFVLVAGNRVDGRVIAPFPGTTGDAGLTAGSDDPPHAQSGKPTAADLGLDGMPSVSTEDAKLLRAVVSDRFPSGSGDILVLDTTTYAAPADPAAARQGGHVSLRGADLGRNVTVVTSTEAFAALSETSESTVLVEFTQPVYETGHHQATVKYKITRRTSEGIRWLTGTGTLALRNDAWAVTKRDESAESDPPVRAGGDVKAPVVTKRVEAIPTAESLQSHVSGMVIIEVTVDESGHVVDTRVLKHLPYGLDAAAITAVKQWEFNPGTLNGKPVPVIYNVLVQFIAK